MRARDRLTRPAGAGGGRCACSPPLGGCAALVGASLVALERGGVNHRLRCATVARYYRLRLSLGNL